MNDEKAVGGGRAILVGSKWRSTGNTSVPSYTVLEVRGNGDVRVHANSSGSGSDHTTTPVDWARLMVHLSDPEVLIGSKWQMNLSRALAGADGVDMGREGDTFEIAGFAEGGRRIDFVKGHHTCRTNLLTYYDWRSGPQINSAGALRALELNASRAKIASAVDKLGHNATALLADIAARLVMGKTNGDFEKDHNWSREAYEEDLDGIVYRAMALRKAAKL